MPLPSSGEPSSRSLQERKTPQVSLLSPFSGRKSYVITDVAVSQEAIRVRLAVYVQSFLLTLTGLSFFAILGAQGSGAPPSASMPEDPLQRPRPAKKQGSRKTDMADKLWLDEEVPYIITPDERNAFRKLTNDTERANFIEQFWRRRDPTPETEENEFKEEYYRRIAFANERFAAGIPGWKTDRGRMYIIHGAPDFIESHPAGGPYQRTAEEGGGQTIAFPFEVWHYRNIDGIGQNIDIEFVDTCICGEYHMSLDPGEKESGSRVGIENLGPSRLGNNLQSKEFDRVERYALLNAPPPIKYGEMRTEVKSRVRYNLLPFDVRVDFVKADANTVLTPITIQVPNRELTFVAKDGVQHASLSLSGTVTTLTGRVASTFEEPLRLDLPAEQLEKFAANVSLYQEALSLRPGHYRLDVMLKDVNGDTLGIFSHSIQVPDFSNEDKLAASTLILADLMDPVPPREIGAGAFVLGTDRVRPRVASNGQPVTFARGQKVNLWMQVYNLSLDKGAQKPAAAVEYHVVNVATGKPVFELLQTTGQMGNVGNQLTLQQRVPPDNLEPGVYEVTIKVNDLVAQQSIAPATKFVVK
jgi:GWxTD domain-containing protein